MNLMTTKNDTMFFSEREQGPKPSTNMTVSDTCWRGIASIVRAKVAEHWFARAFPLRCPDGTQIYDTDVRNLNEVLTGLQLPNPSEEETPDSAAVMDLLEFCHEKVAKPIEGAFHPYFSHHHLSFDIEVGQVEFRREVNRVLLRNGAAYRLADSGQVERIAPPVLDEDLSAALFSTSDPDLDRLLETARRKFLDHRATTRREAIEKLWDAWERLKTVEGGKKSVSADALLDKACAEPKLRERLGAEARSLTEIGNSFQIRHHETDKPAIVSDEHVDYLFHRLFAMIRLLLRSSGRGG